LARLVLARRARRDLLDLGWPLIDAIEDALGLLERAYVDRSDWVMMLHVEPQFDALRVEPRFRELLRRADAAPLP